MSNMLDGLDCLQLALRWLAIIQSKLKLELQVSCNNLQWTCVDLHPVIVKNGNKLATNSLSSNEYLQLYSSKHQKVDQNSWPTHGTLLAAHVQLNLCSWDWDIKVMVTLILTQGQDVYNIFDSGQYTYIFEGQGCSSTWGHDNLELNTRCFRCHLISVAMSH